MIWPESPNAAARRATRAGAGRGSRAICAFSASSEANFRSSRSRRDELDLDLLAVEIAGEIEEVKSPAAARPLSKVGRTPKLATPPKALPPTAAAPRRRRRRADWTARARDWRSESRAAAELWPWTTVADDDIIAAEAARGRPRRRRVRARGGSPTNETTSAPAVDRASTFSTTSTAKPSARRRLGRDSRARPARALPKWKSQPHDDRADAEPRDQNLARRIRPPSGRPARRRRSARSRRRDRARARLRALTAPASAERRPAGRRKNRPDAARR